MLYQGMGESQAVVEPFCPIGGIVDDDQCLHYGASCYHSSIGTITALFRQFHRYPVPVPVPCQVDF